jgi:hypothetical protein
MNAMHGVACCKEERRKKKQGEEAKETCSLKVRYLGMWYIWNLHSGSLYLMGLLEHLKTNMRRTRGKSELPGFFTIML